jgi:hypothetical protein
MVLTYGLRLREEKEESSRPRMVKVTKRVKEIVQKRWESYGIDKEPGR